MRWLTLAAVVLTTCNLAPQVSLAADNTNQIPFKLYRGYAIVARGSIGNVKNLNFLIDTGAVPSVLDQHLAKRLNLAGSTEEMSVFTKKVETQRAAALDVQLGPLHADALPIVVQDLSFAGDAIGTRVDAMIGFDFLSQRAFTIDYGSKRITVGALDPSLVAIPYQEGRGYAIVEMTIRKQRLSLLIDTGASDLVLFGDALHDCGDAIKKVSNQTWSNMGGETQVQQVQLSDTYLGSRAWGSQKVFVLEEASGPAGLRGLLGVASLKARRVGFDPQHRILAWDQENGSVQLSKAAR